MQFTCVALDFDNCLAYHNDGRAGFLNTFTERGFTEDAVYDAYDKAREGFSLKTFLSALEEVSGDKIERRGLKEEFDRWVSSSISLYSDVEDFIALLKSLKIPVAIVTFGEKEHQEQKVRLTGVSYDSLHITSEGGKKFVVLGELVERYGPPIAFVDDKPDELDAAREAFSSEQVGLFRIIRPGGRHINAKSKFKHAEIKTLAEILG